MAEGWGKYLEIGRQAAGEIGRDEPTRLELIDRVEETLRLFTAEDPIRNVAIAVVNTVRGGAA